MSDNQDQVLVLLEMLCDALYGGDGMYKHLSVVRSPT